MKKRTTNPDRLRAAAVARHIAVMMRKTASALEDGSKSDDDQRPNLERVWAMDSVLSGVNASRANAAQPRTLLVDMCQKFGKAIRPHRKEMKRLAEERGQRLASDWWPDDEAEFVQARAVVGVFTWYVPSQAESAAKNLPLVQALVRAHNRNRKGTGEVVGPAEQKLIAAMWGTTSAEALRKASTRARRLGAK